MKHEKHSENEIIKNTKQLNKNHKIKINVKKFNVKK